MSGRSLLDRALFWLTGRESYCRHPDGTVFRTHFDWRYERHFRTPHEEES